MRDADSIPQTGRENPETGPLSASSGPKKSEQTKEGQQLMALEKALAQALQQLAEKEES